MDLLDKVLFRLCQEGLTVEGAYRSYDLLGNFIAWMPLLAFVGVGLYAIRSKWPWLNLLFGLVAISFAFLVGSTLAGFFHRLPPYHFYLTYFGEILPAMNSGEIGSLPDWPVASMTALIWFYRLRAAAHGHRFPYLIWTGVFLLGAFRMLAGYAYPLDLFAGITLGLLVGWFTERFLYNFEIVLQERPH